MGQNLEEKMKEYIQSGLVIKDEPMKKHITFRVGGPADYFAMPKSVKDIETLIQFCKENKLPYYIVGNGSNLLVGDRGFRGMIIQIFKEFSNITVEEDRIKAQAGNRLSVIANTALSAGLGGFEFAAGIPGTLGGAVIMNAGAYGGEMKDVLEDVTVLKKDGTICTLNKEELGLGYRTSKVAKDEDIVLEATIKLERKDPALIKELMDDLKERRVTKQPLEYPSAGSTFKRPEGYFAGKLIQDAGLKGFTVGGAMVSEKHSGFVINKGDATAKDIVDLMNQVTAIVKEKFQVELEPEVKRIGEF